MTPPGTLPTTKLQKHRPLVRRAGVLAVHARARAVGQPAPPAGPPTGKVLFIKLAEQGSTVLAQAAIRRAVEMVGRENVFFVVFAENRFILDLLDLIPRENVFTINAGSLASLVASGWEMLRRIRRMAVRVGGGPGVLRAVFGGVLFPDGRAAAGGLPHVLRRGAVPGRPDDAPAALQPVPAHEPDFRADGRGVAGRPARSCRPSACSRRPADEAPTAVPARAGGDRGGARDHPARERRARVPARR